MAKKQRLHLVNDAAPSSDLTPRHLTKQQFGQRLYRLILKKNWTQSELARQAGIPRNSISVYIRGVSYPTALNVKKLAGALGVKEDEILPNLAQAAIEENISDFSLTASSEDPSKSWLRVNRLVDTRIAVQIAMLLTNGAANGK